MFCRNSNASDEKDGVFKGPVVTVTDSFITSDIYNITHPNRGLVLIFNHYSFDDKYMKPRQGTEKDVKNLQSVFGDLGFTVKIYDDLKYGEVYDVLQNGKLCKTTFTKLECFVHAVSEMDHSNHSCLVVVVMSHGESGVIHARDHSYKPETLWMPFTGDKCSTLAGKPKLFFIQVRHYHV